MLKTRPPRSGQNIKEEIESILTELGAELSAEKARGAGFALKFSSPRGTALFTIRPSALKPEFSFRVTSGSPDAGALNNLGELLLMSAAASVRPGAASPAADKKLLAKILEITESWGAAPPVIPGSGGSRSR